MGVSRDELGELVKTRFVTAGGAVNIQITGEKRSAESVQNDVENAYGFTRVALESHAPLRAPVAGDRLAGLANWISR
jgi:hypothetical protein